MKLLFAHESRYVEYNGELYSSRIDYNSFWTRYLEHFDSVTVMARAKPVDQLPKGYMLSTGKRVRYVAIPYYIGLKEYLRKRSSIAKIIRNTVNKFDAYIFRVPGVLGNVAASHVSKLGKKYVLEVAGDPWEVGKTLPLPLPIRWGLSLYSLIKLRQIVSQSSGAVYVTKSVLQKRYPPPKEIFTASISNVHLEDSWLISLQDTNRMERIKSYKARICDFNTDAIKIGAIGHLYTVKSPLELVKTIATCIKKGLNLEVHFAGDGPLKNEIQKLAAKYGITQRVICHGQIASGKPVMDFLDSIDVFVQFSKTEGLPRALIEAMARGCPAIASRVGGIPDLLPEQWLVKPANVNELANKISKLLSSHDYLLKALRENIKTAQHYKASILQAQRKIFFARALQLFKNELLKRDNNG